MGDIKFLDDNEVAKLFDENSENTDTQQENVTKISSEQVSDLFNENTNEEKEDDNDDDEEEEDNGNDGKVQKTSNDNKGTEPKSDTLDFSSITKEFIDEGIFGELSEDELPKDSKSFKSLIKNAIENGIDEETKKVRTALEAGVEPNDINDIKNTIEFLRSITEKQIYDDSDEGFELRRKLILQDFLNQGIDEKEAVEKTNAVFKKGNDMSVANEALQSNKQYFKQVKDKLFDEAENAKKEHEANIAKQTESLKSAIMDSEKYLGEISLDEKTKKLALKNLSEPIYKDKETGTMLTAIQKYERENKTDFLKNLGILFTITDGFKNMDKVFDTAVRRRVNKEIEDIEDVLKNPARTENNLSAVTSKKNGLIDNFKFDV